MFSKLNCWILERFGYVFGKKYREVVSDRDYFKRSMERIEGEFERYVERKENPDIDNHIVLKELIRLCGEEWLTKSEKGEYRVRNSAPQWILENDAIWFNRFKHVLEGRDILRLVALPEQKAAFIETRRLD